VEKMPWSMPHALKFIWLLPIFFNNYLTSEAVTRPK
jgi:hypothetical protein